MVSPNAVDLWTNEALCTELDKILARYHRVKEPQWHTDVWTDILIAGTEQAGTTLRQSNNVGFNARSLIAFNTSDARLSVTGGIRIPPKATEFVARFKPAKANIRVSFDTAPTIAGEIHIFLTEELLDPTVSAL